MDNLIKAMKCRERWYAEGCDIRCDECEFSQDSYSCTSAIYKAAMARLISLEKSNRNWRRKCQRLRAELRKAASEGDIS